MTVSDRSLVIWWAYLFEGGAPGGTIMMLVADDFDDDDRVPLLDDLADLVQRGLVVVDVDPLDQGADLRFRLSAHGRDAIDRKDPHGD